jgi:4-amino-4-deoxy-L-arabinose transferase-like glycosyltransferase
MLFWCVFSYSVGHFEHFILPPMGVHQSAQCDRASLAQNYYYNGLNFFYPEVNENRCDDGIVSCELPLMSYIAAMGYKLFGYHEFIFRILTFLIFTLGVFSLFNLFKRYTNVLMAYLLIVFLCSSPILLFYANSFLPDAASLGLILIAFYLFFKLHINHSYLPSSNSLILKIAFTICLGLSVAIKTTSLVHWLTICVVLFVSNFKIFEIKIIRKKELFAQLLLSIIIPLGWYLWSRNLALKHNANYFLMKIPEWTNWKNYKEAWQIYLNNWPDQTFVLPLFYFLVFAMVLQFFLFKKSISNLWFLSIVNTLGSFLFITLMMFQFRYHDYYIITLFPAFILNWIYLISYLNTFNKQIVYLKIALIILLIISTNFHFNFGRKNLTERYTSGNYWEQSHQNALDYIAFKNEIKTFNINRDDCILVGYDISPNNILYYLHLRGYRFNSDQNEEKLVSILENSKLKYIISNDIEFENQVKKHRNLSLLKDYKNIKLFQINTNN